MKFSRKQRAADRRNSSEFRAAALCGRAASQRVLRRDRKSPDAAGHPAPRRISRLLMEEGSVMHLGNRTKASLRKSARNYPALQRAAMSSVEPLESRRMFAVTASFAGGVLTVNGDNNANTITVSRTVAGNLLVNNGAVAITGAAATIANTTRINVSGSGGNDSITLDQTNGALPAASLSGGSGDDSINGGAGADTLNGGDGNDEVDGNGGSDIAFLGNGKDAFTWDPGDGSDIIHGQG